MCCLLDWQSTVVCTFHRNGHRSPSAPSSASSRCPIPKSLPKLCGRSSKVPLIETRLPPSSPMPTQRLPSMKLFRLLIWVTTFGWQSCFMVQRLRSKTLRYSSLVACSITNSRAEARKSQLSVQLRETPAAPQLRRCVIARLPKCSSSTPPVEFLMCSVVR